jgi:Trypsin-like peptidase domain
MKSIVCAVGYFKHAERPHENRPDGLGGTANASAASNPYSPAFKIIGSGFLVRKQTVLTNRHVVHAIRRLKTANVHQDAFRVLFDQCVEGGAVPLDCPFLGSAWIRETDVGVIEVLPKSVSYFANLSPARFGRCADTTVGLPISVVGYAFGSEGLIDDNDAGQAVAYRVGPMLHQGFISATSFSGGQLDRLVLDVRTAKCMSGSPVFAAQGGKVIGIHDGGINLVSAFAYPLDIPKCRTILNRWDAQKALLL